jgi:excisionase family DNA binding protein
VTAMLTPPELAERLKVHPEKIRRWIERGELAAVNVADRIGGRPRWRITAEALEDFLRRRATPGPGPRIRRRRRQEKVPEGWVRYYS